jgi:hypothetical protein
MNSAAVASSSTPAASHSIPHDPEISCRSWGSCASPNAFAKPSRWMRHEAVEAQNNEEHDPQHAATTMQIARHRRQSAWARSVDVISGSLAHSARARVARSTRGLAVGAHRARITFANSYEDGATTVLCCAASAVQTASMDMNLARLANVDSQQRGQGESRKRGTFVALPLEGDSSCSAATSFLASLLPSP